MTVLRPLLLGLCVLSCAGPPERRAAAPAPTPAPELSVAAGDRPASEPADEGVREETRRSAAPDPDADRVAPAGVPVAAVGGEPIDVAELLALWMHRDGATLAEMVETLVASRLAVLEAERLGVAVEPALVDEEARVGRRLIEEQLAAGGQPISLEDYVRRELGLDPDRYLGRLREDTRRQILAERVVRSFTLSSPHAIARVIVVPSERRLESVQEALAEGRAFADVAREFSIDPSARNGGLAPPLVRIEQSPLARLAFRTPVGEVGGPIEMMGQHMLLRVEARPEPLSGTWAETRAAVEASLEERPVEDGEYLQWKLAQERLYGVDRTALFELVGEPLQ